MKRKSSECKSRELHYHQVKTHAVLNIPQYNTQPTPQAIAAALTQQVDNEQISEVLLTFTGGTPPTWLHGMYIKNGPGTFKGMEHLFDGYGMLTKTRFDHGNAFFSSRYLQSEAFKSFSAGNMAFSEFGTSVGLMRNLWNTVKLVTGAGLGALTMLSMLCFRFCITSLPGVTDNSSVNLVPDWSTGEVLTTTESVAGTYRYEWLFIPHVVTWYSLAHAKPAVVFLTPNPLHCFLPGSTPPRCARWGACSTRTRSRVT